MAPAPGRMPMMVPTTEHLATIHFTERNSFRLGILADMLLFPPTAVSLEGLAVCFSTSVTAKKPIITGIISMPEVRKPGAEGQSRHAQQRDPGRCRPSSSPSRPEMMVRQMLSVSRLVRMDSPMKEMAKSSDGSEAQGRLGQLGAQEQHADGREHSADGGADQLHAQGLSGLAPLGHGIAVIGGGRAGGHAGDLEQDGRHAAAGDGGAVDGHQEGDGAHRIHLVGERDAQGHGHGRRHSRKGSEEGAQEHGENDQQKHGGLKYYR